VRPARNPRPAQFAAQPLVAENSLALAAELGIVRLRCVMTGALPAPPLRQWQPHDGPSIVRHANDYEVWRSLRDRFPHPYTPHDAEAWLSLVCGSSPPLEFAITSNDEAVGGIGLIPGSDIDRVSAEVGYWLGRSAWGHGLASAAVRSITAYAFQVLALERVFALPFEGNLASARVLVKAGYKLEGVLRCAAIKEGRLTNLLMFGCTRSDLNLGSGV
jgi:ribosomal-protein-alanine N-acetyltransferase